ncbi:MAG: hypothetical protein U0869_07005 [Chloroflexota bacterium]
MATAPAARLSQKYLPASAAPATLSVLDERDAVVAALGVDEHDLDAGGDRLIHGWGQRHGSVGASAMPATPWVIASSIWVIWDWTSDSSGGDITVTSTPYLAPIFLGTLTAAQNGLPPPGPFMLTMSFLPAAGC